MKEIASPRRNNGQRIAKSKLDSELRKLPHPLLLPQEAHLPLNVEVEVFGVVVVAVEACQGRLLLPLLTQKQQHLLPQREMQREAVVLGSHHPSVGSKQKDLLK